MSLLPTAGTSSEHGEQPEQHDHEPAAYGYRHYHGPSTLASSSRSFQQHPYLSKGASQLSSQTDQVATAMTEVSQTIMDMAKNASSAADASKSASDTAAKASKP